MKKFNIYNETNKDLVNEIKKIKKIVKIAVQEEKQKDAYFNIIIVNNEYIHKLNKEYRKIDRETDVITFALEDEEKEELDSIKILGDIYISIDKAMEQSIEYSHSLDRELCFLAIHGFYHLLGYDHMNKEDEKIMFAKQDVILNKKNFAKRNSKN